jgi:hypothetical protein
MKEDLQKIVEQLQAKVTRLETTLVFSHHPLCDFWRLPVGKGGGCKCAVYHHSEIQHLLDHAAEQGRKATLVPPAQMTSQQAATTYRE